VSVETPRPTAAEMEILAVLWERGPSTVRQVHDVLTTRRATGYTTVLKLLQIMAGKGLVERDESDRSHVYQATHEQGAMQGELVGDLIDRAFAGSTSQLVLRALAQRPTDPRELAEIRTLLDRMLAERERKRR
jgi:BlaI family penicillinase repressor